MRTHSSVNGRFIVDAELTDGTRLRNYTGTLQAAFAGPRGDAHAEVGRAPDHAAA